MSPPEGEEQGHKLTNFGTAQAQVIYKHLAGGLSFLVMYTLLKNILRCRCSCLYPLSYTTNPFIVYKKSMFEIVL